MTITKERWAQIEDELDSLYRTVHLRADGYIVSASLMRLGNRLLVKVWVNGQMRTAWFPKRGEPMAEEARRFWRHIAIPIVSAKTLRAFEKTLGKRECKKHGYYDKFIWAEPRHLSAKAFCRHLRRHNTEIAELTPEEIEAFQAELKAAAAAEAAAKESAA